MLEEPEVSGALSFLESRLTILFRELISLLPRGWIEAPAPGSASCFGTDVGLSGFDVDTPEIMLVGLGGGGRLGGAVFEDGYRLAGLLSPSFLSCREGAFDALLNSGIKLLILRGGGGRETLGGPCGALTGFASRPAKVEVAAFVGVVMLSAFAVFARGDTFLEGGGGGRGILGGGGIIRPVGLFTFFILALALGGGTGVDTGVPFFAPLFRLGVLVSADSAGLGVGMVPAAALPAAAASAGGRGGGGRRCGLSMAVRLFLARCLATWAVGGTMAGTGVFTAGEASLLSTTATSLSSLLVLSAVA